MEHNPTPYDPPTREAGYSEQLLKSQKAWWRQLFNVQAPYRRNLRRIRPGFMLDIGCGLGRHLLNIDGNGVGIDHNTASVQYARSQGLTVFTPEEFQRSGLNQPGRFDSILLSHVAEHMTQDQVITLLGRYTRCLKPDGKLIIITPQEAGFNKDATHREFVDFGRIREIAKALGFTPLEEYSFPLPRFWGHFFYFNEFISVSARG